MSNSPSTSGRRLTKIKVDEVSSVGIPANEQEFIVLKGTRTMKIQFSDAVAKAMPANLKGGIKATVQFLGRLLSDDYPEPAKKDAGFDPTELKKSAEAVGAFFESVAKGDAEYPVETQGYTGATDHMIAADLLTDLVVAKGTPDTLQRSVANLIAFLAKATDPEEEDEDKKKAKKEEDDEEKKKAKGDDDEEEGKKKAKKGEDEEEDEDMKGAKKSFEDQLADVLKAKRITPARAKALKDLHSSLGALLKEVGVDDDEEEKDKKKAKADDEDEADKKKAKKEDEEEEKDAKKGEAIPSWAVEMKKQLDKIESTRAPSKDGSGNETKDVEKGSANLWGGQFLPRS